MSRNPYVPGPAAGAHIQKDGDRWTLVLVRDLPHPPAKVWVALTEPAHLSQWAPFDADRSLGAAGPVKLTTVGAPTLVITDDTVQRAEAPHLLELTWGGKQIRWELEPAGTGTRLTLWHNIDRAWISMGASGWHICFDVMDRLLGGEPLGRTVGPGAMKIDGWAALNAGYAKQLGVEPPAWPAPPRT